MSKGADRNSDHLGMAGVWGTLGKDGAWGREANSTWIMKGLFKGLGHCFN